LKSEETKDSSSQSDYDVIIESSPFIRAMKTVSHIAKELNVGKISVNYKYSENLHSDCIFRNPFLEN
jgi:broad specificity phosphatase PhoE